MAIPFHGDLGLRVRGRWCATLTMEDAETCIPQQVLETSEVGPRRGVLVDGRAASVHPWLDE